jgi:hypothetical protein
MAYRIDLDRPGDHRQAPAHALHDDDPRHMVEWGQITKKTAARTRSDDRFFLVAFQIIFNLHHRRVQCVYPFALNSR